MRCHLLLLIYRSVQVGVYWGLFCCAAPPGGGSGPLRSFLSLLDPLTLFKVLSPNFSAHDLLHHAGWEPTSLAIVQPFTQNPAWGQERRICHESLERRKTGRRATKIVKQNRGKEETCKTSSCKWQQMMQKWKTKTWSSLKQQSLIKLHGLLQIFCLRHTLTDF